MAVVKTDGYGHGAVPIARLFEETAYVWGYATASLEEAVLLRDAGLKKPILVLGCVFPEQYEEMVSREIRPTVYTKEMAEEMSRAAVKLRKTAYFYIKIDTGMGRIGFPVSEDSADTIAEIGKLPGVVPEGMFTHFAKADETDPAFTREQHERFVWMRQALEQRKLRIPCLSCDNSAGIIDFPEYRHNLVRAGIALYGMYPSDEVDQKAVPLKPALELISHISYVKDVEEGTPISYGGTFVSDRKMRVATIPVGYGDGYPRSLSGRGEVLIRGKRAKILGRICMDMTMVDLTGLPEVHVGDEVEIFGNRQPVDELAEMLGTIPYELTCAVSKRVPRVYIQGGEVVERSLRLLL